MPSHWEDLPRERLEARLDRLVEHGRDDHGWQLDEAGWPFLDYPEADRKPPNFAAWLLAGALAWVFLIGGALALRAAARVLWEALEGGG